MQAHAVRYTAWLTSACLSVFNVLARGLTYFVKCMKHDTVRHGLVANLFLEET